jgi:hypothetical protein
MELQPQELQTPMIHTFTGTGRIAVPNNTVIDSNLLHIVILQLMYVS